MTGSPFSNVVGHDQGSSTFADVESTETSDTTDRDAARPADTGTEPAGGVQQGREAAQDETPGDAPSGQ